MNNILEKSKEELEKYIHEDVSKAFNSECIRKKSNLSTLSHHDSMYKFDHPDFSKEEFLDEMSTRSPKVVALLNKIEELDRMDKNKYGKKFKHFIFSDVKSGYNGVKLLAAGLEAKGFHCGYTAPLRNDYNQIQKRKVPKKKPNTPESDADSDNSDNYETVSESESDDDNDENENASSESKKDKKMWGKIIMTSEEELAKTAYQNFLLLSSKSVYQQAINVSLKKKMLALFNRRPDNVYGRLARIMIMDSGYKEGIDLFDIKYIHIFEPTLHMADLKQIIGRGTRTCGQKGLDFHPSRGWSLDVFVYDMKIPDKVKDFFLDSKTTMELYMKSMKMDFRILRFSREIEDICIIGSVDYDLNRNIHTFSIAEQEEEMQGGSNIKIPKKLKIRKTNAISMEPVIAPTQSLILPNGITIANQPEHRMKYEGMRTYIAEHFKDFEWEKIEMENKCIDPEKEKEKEKEEKNEKEKEKEKSTGTVIETNSANKLMSFNPTQNFIRHFFTPDNPLKGMLLWHSVGTGKTCTAIATASSTFEQQGYTILWVTKTTLKSDIWKNMFDQICSETIRDKITQHNLTVPEDMKDRMKLLSKAWSIRPMSYKQFSNLVSKKINSTKHS